MNLLARIFRFLAYSNLIVSIAAVALVAFTIQVMGYQTDFFILSAIFFGTLFAYSFQRKISLLSNGNTSPSAQNDWINRHTQLNNTITILSFIACFYILYHLPAESILFIAPLATLSLLYVLRIGNWPALRNIPFLKVFLVAFVWGGVMVMLPSIYESHSLRSIFTLKNQLLSLSLAFFVFGQSLPFDIRDIHEDKAASLDTIPHKIGIFKTLIICWLSLAFALIFSTISYVLEFVSGLAYISFTLAIFSTAVLLFYYKKPRPAYCYSIFLESCLILPFLYYKLMFYFFW